MQKLIIESGRAEKNYWHEACEIADWVFNLDPGFRSSEKGLRGVLYRRVGFRKAELLLRLRRDFLALFRAKTKSQGLQLE